MMEQSYYPFPSIHPYRNYPLKILHSGLCVCKCTSYTLYAGQVLFMLSVWNDHDRKRKVRVALWNYALAHRIVVIHGMLYIANQEKSHLPQMRLSKSNALQRFFPK